MPSNPSLHYETIATAFRVAAVAQPLRTSAPPGWSLEDVWAAILEDSEGGENWFVLVTGLEVECMRLFSARPRDTARYLSHLPKGRYQLALDHCNKRSDPTRITPGQILPATQFIDKGTMLLREPMYLGALPFKSKREGDRFFNQLLELRNSIAHSNPILNDVSPEKLNQLLNKLKELTTAVTQLAQRSAGEDDLGPPTSA